MEALSSSLRFAPESDAVRALRGAMQEAVDQDAVIELPEPDGAASRAVVEHEALLRESGARSACTVPLTWGERIVGALACAWSAPGAIDPARRERLRDAGLVCGPLLGLLARAEEWPE